MNLWEALEIVSTAINRPIEMLVSADKPMQVLAFAVLAQQQELHVRIAFQAYLNWWNRRRRELNQPDFK